MTVNAISDGTSIPHPSSRVRTAARLAVACLAQLPALPRLYLLLHCVPAAADPARSARACLLTPFPWFHFGVGIRRAGEMHWVTVVSLSRGVLPAGCVLCK